MSEIRVGPLLDSSELLGDARALAERARAEGYLFLRRLVPADIVYDLRNVALAAAEHLGFLDPGAPRSAAIGVPGLGLGAPGDPRWVELCSLALPHPAFDALRRDAALGRVIAALLGTRPDATAGDVLRVVSGDALEHTAPSHQDREYVKGSGWLWTAWLPLGDCPLSLGPIAVLPRSHEQGLLPHEGGALVRAPDDATFRASDLVAGDAVLFSGHTVHRALPNRSGRRLRLSADYRFQG
jgi:hypothetical protein